MTTKRIWSKSLFYWLNRLPKFCGFGHWLDNLSHVAGQPKSEDEQKHGGLVWRGVQRLKGYSPLFSAFCHFSIFFHRFPIVFLFSNFFPFFPIFFLFLPVLFSSVPAFKDGIAVALVFSMVWSCGSPAPLNQPRVPRYNIPWILWCWPNHQSLNMIGIVICSDARCCSHLQSNL